MMGRAVGFRLVEARRHLAKHQFSGVSPVSGKGSHHPAISPALGGAWFSRAPEHDAGHFHC